MTNIFDDAAALGFSVMPCSRPLKVPTLKWAHYQKHHATSDERAVWSAANHNVGIPTGAVSAVFILDLDTPEAHAEADRRGVPLTYSVSTPGGTHLYFKHPGWNVSNNSKKFYPGMDIRGDGGFVLGPGSYFVPDAAERARGKVEGSYDVQMPAAIAEAPLWLLDLVKPPEFVPMPAAPAVECEETTRYGAKVLREECERLRDHPPGHGMSDQLYKSAVRVAELVAGGEIVHDEAFDAIEAIVLDLVGDEEKAYRTLARAWAKGLDQPWSPVPLPPARTASDVFGPRDTLPAQDNVPEPPTGVERPSLDDEQLKDKNNHLTVLYWILGCGYQPRYDEFADRIMLGDQPLTDHLERKAWFDAREKSGLKFPKDLFGDVLRATAWRCRHHPVRQWLDAAQPLWDGTPRIDSWLSTFLGVAPTAYTAAVGALFLTAAVRRVRHPGAKFDEMVVLEGAQGIEKSTAVAALCPQADWFCDDLHLGMTSKELLEVTLGKWLVEAPELTNMSNREAEHVKAMLSRRFDRARMAFERNTTERGRQWVSFGTTNSNKYLSDPTGNRRIWPITVGTIDVAGLVEHREQLWAEAAVREASGASIRLPRELWAAAGAEQEQRVLLDAFEDALAPVLAAFDSGRVRVTLLWDVLRIPVEKRPAHTKRLGEAMRTMGWNITRKRVENSERVSFYQRGDDEREIIFEAGNAGKLQYEPPQFTVIGGGKL